MTQCPTLRRRSQKHPSVPSARSPGCHRHKRVGIHRVRCTACIQQTTYRNSHRSYLSGLQERYSTAYQLLTSFVATFLEPEFWKARNRWFSNLNFRLKMNTESFQVLDLYALCSESDNSSRPWGSFWMFLQPAARWSTHSSRCDRTAHHPHIAQWLGRRLCRLRSTRIAWWHLDDPRVKNWLTSCWRIRTSVWKRSQFLILDLGISLTALMCPVSLCTALATSP